MAAALKAFLIFFLVGVCHANPRFQYKRDLFSDLFALPQKAIETAEHVVAPAEHIFGSLLSNIPVIGSFLGGGHGGSHGGKGSVSGGGLGALGGVGGLGGLPIPSHLLSGLGGLGGNGLLGAPVGQGISGGQGGSSGVASSSGVAGSVAQTTSASQAVSSGSSGSGTTSGVGGQSAAAASASAAATSSSRSRRAVGPLGAILQIPEAGVHTVEGILKTVLPGAIGNIASTPLEIADGFLSALSGLHRT